MMLRFADLLRSRAGGAQCTEPVRRNRCHSSEARNGELVARCGEHAMYHHAIDLPSGKESRP